MLNLMEKGVAWLARQQRRHFAVPVIYERPSDAVANGVCCIPCQAVLGQPGATGEESVASIRIDATELDFLIVADELVWNGRRLEPKVDDRILLQRGGMTQVYEVLPRGGGPPWRWSDPQKTILRLHTKLTEELQNDC